MKHLQELEITLHKYATRADLKKLTVLLHPNYIEIGYSGRTYDFDSIVEDLLSESKQDFEIWSQEYKINELASNMVQLIYKSARVDGQGRLSRHAKRASIWIKESGKWQMKFHQATPVGAFEKVNA